jgi:hypothetical protein
MTTVTGWLDCARCKRPMTMVDSRECADGPVWRCLKCPTPDERGELRSAEDRMPQRRSWQIGRVASESKRLRKSLTGRIRMKQAAD